MVLNLENFPSFFTSNSTNQVAQKLALGSSTQTIFEHSLITKSRYFPTPRLSWRVSFYRWNNGQRAGQIMVKRQVKWWSYDSEMRWNVRKSILPVPFHVSRGPGGKGAGIAFYPKALACIRGMAVRGHYGNGPWASWGLSWTGRYRH